MISININSAVLVFFARVLCRTLNHLIHVMWNRSYTLLVLTLVQVVVECHVAKICEDFVLELLAI